MRPTGGPGPVGLREPHGPVAHASLYEIMWFCGHMLYRISEFSLATESQEPVLLPDRFLKVHVQAP